jgi:hypothetical protein
MKNLTCLIVLSVTSVMTSNVQAQQLRSSEDIYFAMRQARSDYDFETLNGKCPSKIYDGYIGATCITENLKNEFELSELLRLRGAAGEPAALFLQWTNVCRLS